MHSTVTILAILFVWPVVAVNAPGSIDQPQERQSDMGKIVGVVSDKNDARIANAQVTIEGSGQERRLVTDEAGEFAIDLSAGVYYLHVSAHGFRDFHGAALRVNSGTTEMINIHMTVAVYTNPA